MNLEPPRLPWEPLEAFLRKREPRIRQGVEGWSADQIATVLGCTSRTVFRLRTEGLTPRRADRFAIAAGSHPAEIWGEQWEYACIIDELQRQRECTACGAVFYVSYRNPDRTTCRTRCAAGRRNPMAHHTAA